MTCLFCRSPAKIQPQTQNTNPHSQEDTPQKPEERAQEVGRISVKESKQMIQDYWGHSFCDNIVNIDTAIAEPVLIQWYSRILCKY